MKKAILFDLDATLIQFDQKTFEYEYFKRITKRITKLGFNPEQFMAQLNKSVKEMYKNDGSKTNEQVFSDCMKEVYGEENFKVIDQQFTELYNNNYDNLEEIATPTPEIKDLIDWCKHNFDYVLLTTNPFFPRFAVQNRLNWTKSGLKLEDFDLVTTYEYAHYSKPNPKYFEEVLNKFNLTPSDCVMVGNNELEDYITASKLGMEAYLVGDHIMPYPEAEQHPEPISLKNLINVLKITQSNK